MARLSLGEYRSHFGETSGYMDFARWGPPSDLVMSRSASALSTTFDGLTDIGTLRSHEQQALSLVAKMTGRIESDAAVLTPSTSAGLFQVAFGMSGGPDDELLLSPGEFPANIYPWVRAQQRGGPRISWLKTPDGRVTPDIVAKSLTPATIALVVSAVDYRTGYRADLTGLREVLGNRFLLVDGIQGFGSCDMDWAATDALVVGGQKWMRSSWGTGFISVSDRALNRMNDGLTGWTGVQDFRLYDGKTHVMASTAKRFELTNPDLVAASMFTAGLELVEDVSISIIEREIQLRVGALIDVIESNGGQTLVSLASNERSGIVSFQVPGTAPRSVGREFELRGIRASVYADYVRLAPHATTPISSVDDVEAALSSLRGIGDLL